MLSLILGGRASAQSIAGHFIGENRSNLENVSWQNSFDGYVDGTFNAANGVKVSITSEKSTEKLVRLEAAWDGRGLSQLAYFSDFRFGKTTLAAIRQRFGNLGIMPASGSPVVSTSDGGVAISSFYEVADSAVVATFVTKISRSGLIDLKRRYGADAYAHMATVATLHSVALSDIRYFETLGGTTSVVDVGYRPIVWQPTDNMAAGRKDRYRSHGSNLHNCLLRAFIQAPGTHPILVVRAQRFETTRTRSQAEWPKVPLLPANLQSFKSIAGHDVQTPMSGTYAPEKYSSCPWGPSQPGPYLEIRAFQPVDDSPMVRL